MSISPLEFFGEIIVRHTSIDLFKVVSVSCFSGIPISSV